MSEFYIFYTESNIVCVIIFGIMYTHDLLSVDRQEKQIKYDRALLAFMLYFLSDAFWAAVVEGIVPFTKFTVIISNLLNYFLMAGITYTWLSFVMAVEQVPYRNRIINRFAIASPFLVSTIALIATYLLAPHTLIDDALEVRPLFNVFLVGAPYINIIAIIFFTMKKAKDERNPIEKRKHLYIGLFPLMVIAGGLVEMLLMPDTPIFCFSSTILMLLIYIQSMEAQISLDPLTQLNNRGQLMRYVSQRSNLYRADRATYVIMLDINDFKAINDNFGHAEGDRALTITAGALKKAISRHSMPAFLGRYGGDEFILIIHPESENDPTTLIAEIRERIESDCLSDGTPYIISISAGYDKLISEQDSFQQCIQRADHKLYLDKEYSKLRGRSAVSG